MRRKICLFDDRHFQGKKSFQYVLVGTILLFTLGLYANSLTNDFTNWDDPAYVTETLPIREFSVEGIKNLFFTTFKTAELSLTIFSFAVDYKLWRLNPYPYHLENLILHLGNVLLVFLFIRRVTHHYGIALLTALLFAIHPFRVESVTWVSQRKDVLYACFYLSGLFSYVKYIQTQYQRRYLLLAALLFICSLLSKDAAVTFVFVLLLIDYYLDRLFHSRTMLEKVPFAVILLLRLWNHYIMPHTVQPLIMAELKKAVMGDLGLGFHLIDRIFLGCYALSWYVIGLFAPINLAIIHPFPVKTDHFLPLKYYFSPLFLLFVWLLIALLLKSPFSRKVIVFGVLFFLITISIALHIVPIGGISVVAERYTYLASIGVFFLVSHVIVRVFENTTEYASYIKSYVVTLLTLYIVFFSVSTYHRNAVWENSLTLWNDQIERYPTVAIAYNNRGSAKESLGDYHGAINDFDQAIALNPNYTKAYSNRGNVKDKLGDYHGAIEDFNTVLILNPNDGKVYNNRGIMKGILGEYHDSIEDFNRAIALNSNYARAYINRGNAYAKIGNDDQAMTDFSQAITLNPTLASAYYNRAILYVKKQACHQASSDVRQIQDLGGQIPPEFFEFFHQNCQYNDFPKPE